MNDAPHGNSPDKPTILGDESDGDAVTIGPGFHLKVAVAAGSEQPLDGGPHIGDAEGLVHLERKQVVALGGGEGL